jgi:hypothetical protein
MYSNGVEGLAIDGRVYSYRRKSMTFNFAFNAEDMAVCCASPW